MAAIEEAPQTTTTTIATDPPKKYTLRTSDGEIFVVDEAVAMQSQTVKHMIEDSCADDVIPIPNVTAAVMAKVIEYCNRQVSVEKTTTELCEYRRDSGAPDDEAKAWNTKFVDIDQDMLFDIILAANYLNIKTLLDLMCQTVADMFKGKTPEELREHFHIVNDYTKEEEDEVRRENAWAFE